MPFSISAGAPGVFVEERDFTNIIPGVSTSAGALAAALNWGPVDKIMTIASENELVERVGKPTDSNFEGFFLAADFLAYANNLKLARVIGDGAKNATIGGVGTGLTVAVTALNGVLQSFTVTSNARGTGYVVGDQATIAGGTTPAKIRVTEVDNVGGVTAATLLVAGTGYATGTGVATTVVSSVLVKNDEDFEDSEVLPDVIARYPGSLGNGLMFSAIRASEFDLWRFRDRFVKPPAAVTLKWDGAQAVKTFALPSGFSAPSDTIVTVAGVKRSAGTDPGQYQISGETLSINTDSETFTANGATRTFTLANDDSLDTTGHKVTVGSTVWDLYTGVGDVPYGKARVVGDTVDLGVHIHRLNGDGATLAFVLTGVAAAADAKVLVDGVAKTVVTSGSPTSTQALVASAGGNTTVTFAIGSAPGIGVGNIVIERGFVASGNVVVEYGFPPAGKDKVKLFHTQTGIHVAVADKLGTIVNGDAYTLLERYSDLTNTPGTKFFDGASSYVKDVINRNSNYVRLSSMTVFAEQVFNNGADGDAPSDAQMVAGYALFRDGDSVDVSHVIGGGASKEQVVSIISNLTEYRRDVVAYFTPPKALEVANRGNELADILAFKQDLPSTSYGHFANGWKYRLDPHNGKYRWVSCAADHAGLYSQVHTNQAPWVAGAGFDNGRLKNVVRLAWSPNKTEKDELYANEINPTANFLNEGPILFGDKTMQTKDSAFQGMNVRWTFIVLEKAIAKAARYFLFQNNTEFTRNRFKNMVIPYLRDVKAGDGIEDYRVKCDEDNNTGLIRMQRKFVGDIYVKPVYSINFINLRFTAVSAEVSFEESIQN